LVFADQGPFRAVQKIAILHAKSEAFREILVKRFTLMLMTGKEYLQSIRDGRVIYIGKERVKDQTTHPAFADGARTYAALFDLKSDPALRDVMTFEEGGERYSMYYLQPRSQEDLRHRNRVHRKIADFCFGLMGRTPDAFAGNLTGLSLRPEVFDSEPGGSRNAERFEREEQLVRRGGKSRIRVPPPAAIARHVPRYWSAAARRPLQAQG
jgi:hypothetical protein